VSLLKNCVHYMPVVSKIFFLALDDKFKFCFLLFLGDISVHMCVGIKFCTRLNYYFKFLYRNIQINGIWYQAGGLNPVSKLVFVKIENNNLLCVVLIKTIVFDMHT
jgi:hypothetical protein